MAAFDYSALIALLGTMGTIIQTVLKRKTQKASAKKDQTIELLKDNIYTTKLRTLKQVFDLKSFSKLEALLNRVFLETEMDRFTVMFLMNGKIDFKYMSVLFDQSQQHDTPLDTPYVKVRIDDIYHSLVTALPSNKAHWEDSPWRVGEIGEYLEMEGVKTVGWMRVKRVALDHYNDLLIYCCWSSKSNTVTRHEKRKTELTTAGRIIPLLEEILAVPLDDDAQELLAAIKTDV